jgi:import inner membrane translocase subunit TIM21
MAACYRLKAWTYCGTASKQCQFKICAHRLQTGFLKSSLKILNLSNNVPTLKHFSSSSVLLKSTSNDVTEVKTSEIKTATYTQKAKENAKTASYGMVIVVGVGVTCIVLYTVLSELFSGESPTGLFQMASDKCVDHPKVQDLLGEPIKAFGEETRRGRRRHVTHLDYVDEHGKKGMRVQFYLQGLRKRGTAQIDAREGENGKLKTRYIIVTADDLLRTSIVVEDNR